MYNIYNESVLLFIKFVNQVSFHKTIYNLDHFFGDKQW